MGTVLADHWLHDDESLEINKSLACKNCICIYCIFIDNLKIGGLTALYFNLRTNVNFEAMGVPFFILRRYEGGELTHYLTILIFDLQRLFSTQQLLTDCRSSRSLHVFLWKKLCWHPRDPQCGLNETFVWVNNRNEWVNLFLSLFTSLKVTYLVLDLDLRSRCIGAIWRSQEAVQEPTFSFFPIVSITVRSNIQRWMNLCLFYHSIQIPSQKLPQFFEFDWAE